MTIGSSNMIEQARLPLRSTNACTSRFKFFFVKCGNSRVFRSSAIKLVQDCLTNTWTITK